MLDPFETGCIEYHPLDHRAGSRECRTMPGGTLHHLAVTWEYSILPTILTVLLCRFGRHDWLPHATPDLGHCLMCLNCCALREP